MALSNGDIFNISVSKDDLENKSGGGGLEDLIYKLNAKDGKNNNASAIIKFLPDINNPSKLWVQKWTVWLENFTTDEKRIIECPSSIKQPSPLQEAFFELRNSPNASESVLQNHFKRKEVFYSLVEVIQDPQHPELEGQIKVFRYGIKLFNKIKNIMFPEGMDENAVDNELIEKNIPFDLFTGKPLHLKVKIVSGFNNYDDSIFIANPYPIKLVQYDENGKIMRGADGKVVRGKIEATAANYGIIEEYLKEHTPCSLSEFEFKPWDDATWDYVINAIYSIVDNPELASKILKKFGRGDNVGKKTIKTKAPVIDLDEPFGKAVNVVPIKKKKAVVEEDDEIDMIIKSSNSYSTKSEPTAKKSTKVDFDDDLDDIELDEIDVDDESDYDDL